MPIIGKLPVWDYQGRIHLGVLKTYSLWSQLPWKQQSKSLRLPLCEEAQVSHIEKSCLKRDDWLAVY